MMNGVGVIVIMTISILSGTLVGTSLIYTERIDGLQEQVQELELMIESCQKAVETCVEIYNEVKTP